MTYNYTDTFRVVMELSFEKAKTLGLSQVNPELLIYGILQQGDELCVKYIRDLGVYTDNLSLNYKRYIEAEESINKDETIEPRLSDKSSRIISEAVRYSQRVGAEAVSALHLCVALFQIDESASDYVSLLKKVQTEEVKAQDAVRSLKDSIESAIKYMHNRIREEASESDDDEEDDLIQTEASRNPRSKPLSGKTPMIERFGRDLTAFAKEGKLDPVIGRDIEIERMVQVLARRRKCNPMLIGEPGVGKTSLVEGLAQRIVNQQVPSHLLAKRLIDLDLSAVVAGTRYRGDFEERIKDIVEELESNQDIIVYIDEIHTMVGAGAGSGSMDAANMLKPALSRGTIQCIGSTTLEEYRKHIEKDGALERRFQKIILEPCSPEATLEILKQLRPHYETYHHVRFSDEALEAMVSLADRYIHDRYFPDKAIDLLDETGARLGNKAISEEVLSPLTDLERERTSCVARRLEAIKEQKFEMAQSFRRREIELDEAISEAKERIKEQTDRETILVGAENVAEVLAMMTAIPVQYMSTNERERLRGLAERLRAKVVGQDTAVDTIAKSIKRNRLGLRDSRKPIGSFLFLGPTGVGKTYLVKCLAQELFGSEDALIRVDMSEYMEKFAVSRLIGAPPGYVGYEEGGQLTEQVRRKPYSIVLFDEIEKAHTDVYNLLLQLLDEGYLTDSYGRRVDFRNTIVVITSNVGSREARNFARGIGYSDIDTSLERTTEIIRKSLNKTFSPEFLNRLDEIVTFTALSEQAIKSIIDIELLAIRRRLSALGYSLELDDAAISLLATKAYSTEYGARPLKRTLQAEIEDRLTDLILEERITPGGTLRLTAVDGQIVEA